MTAMAIGNAPRGGDVEEVIDDNDIDIKSMQALRKTFIADLMVNGHFPKDQEDRQALMALMKDTTSSAIASKRIKVDEKTSASNAQIAANLAEAVRIGQAQKSAANRVANKNRRDVDVVDVVLVPGHTDIGILPVNTAAIAAGTLNKIE